MRKEVEDEFTQLVADTLTLLCKSGLPYKVNCSIKALIGITLDHTDIILVDVKETVGEGRNKSVEVSSSKENSGVLSPDQPAGFSIVRPIKTETIDDDVVIIKQEPTSPLPVENTFELNNEALSSGVSASQLEASMGEPEAGVCGGVTRDHESMETSTAADSRELLVSGVYTLNEGRGHPSQGHAQGSQSTAPLDNQNTLGSLQSVVAQQPPAPLTVTPVSAEGLFIDLEAPEYRSIHVIEPNDTERDLDSFDNSSLSLSEEPTSPSSTPLVKFDQCRTHREKLFKAAESVKNGKISLVGASNMTGFPIKVLKQALTWDGKTRIPTYTNDQLKQALNAVVSRGMRQTDAAKQYCVPLSSVKRAFKNSKNGSIDASDTETRKTAGSAQVSAQTTPRKLHPTSLELTAKKIRENALKKAQQLKRKAEDSPSNSSSFKRAAFRSYTQEQYESAINAIINDGLEQAAASRLYCVPATTLHSAINRRRKEGNLKPKIEEKSTVKKQKSQVDKKWQLPFKFKESDSRPYTKDQYIKALNAVKNAKMGIKEAAEKYGLPVSTLKATLYKLKNPKGKPSYLKEIKAAYKPSLASRYTQEQYNKAVDILAKVRSPVTAARETGVPLTTTKSIMMRIRRDQPSALKPSVKTCVKSPPQSPSLTSPTRTYTQEQLENAIQSLLDEEMDLKQASEIYGVPRGTLYYQLSLMDQKPKLKSEPTGSSKSASKGVVKAAAKPEELTEIGIPKKGLDKCLTSVKSYGKYSVDDYRAAIETLWQNPQSFKQVAQKYNIPNGNLSRTIARLKNRAKNATFSASKPVLQTKFSFNTNKPQSRYKTSVKAAVKFSNYKAKTNYSMKSLELAVKSIVAGKLTISGAYAKYGVPKSTLYHMAHGKRGAAFRKRLAAQASGINSDVTDTNKNSTENTLDASNTIRPPSTKYTCTSDIPVEVLEQAIRKVVESGISMSRVAKKTRIPITRLRYHVGLYREMKNELNTKIKSERTSSPPAPALAATVAPSSSSLPANLEAAVNRVVRCHGNYTQAASDAGVPIEDLRQHVAERRCQLKLSKRSRKAGKSGASAARRSSVGSSKDGSSTHSQIALDSFVRLESVTVNQRENYSDISDTSEAEMGPVQSLKVRLDSALSNIKSGAFSLRQAAETYDIPMADLMDAVNDFL